MQKLKAFYVLASSIREVDKVGKASAVKTGPPAIIFVFAGRFLLIIKMCSSESNWRTVNPNKFRNLIHPLAMLKI
jgi:hypothetical protein